jgi:GNAT superfamily N-acetyltransferase
MSFNKSQKLLNRSIELSDHRPFTPAAMLALYRANQWSAADKPELLYQSLLHSHSLITAWQGEQLVGLGTAISDGYLLVYYPHLLVHPAFHGQGIGRMIMERMQEKYAHFHMQMLTADGLSVKWALPKRVKPYRCGFMVVRNIKYRPLPSTSRTPCINTL